jgi:hypothetical protein
VIEFYQTRTGTKMTTAAERLAMIAAVTLPITALSSILGMNVIVADHVLVGPLVVVLAVMLVMSAVLMVDATEGLWGGRTSGEGSWSHRPRTRPSGLVALAADPLHHLLATVGGDHRRRQGAIRRLVEHLLDPAGVVENRLAHPQTFHSGTVRRRILLYVGRTGPT